MQIINDIKRTIKLQLTKSVVKLTPTEDLKDKVVIITGASKGIGKATAEILLNEGAKVVVVSRNINELNKIFHETKEDRCLKIGADITLESDVKKIVNQTIDHFRKIDVLINNAGIFLNQPLERSSVKHIDDILSTNIRSAIIMSRQVIPYMKKRREGFILNIGSKISRNTNVSPNKSLYAASKYALEGFSYALNKELKSFGIRVSCLMPGTVNTFFSLQSGNYLSPYRVGQIISMLIKFGDVDFENLVIKSINQNI